MHKSLNTSLNMVKGYASTVALWIDPVDGVDKPPTGKIGQYYEPFKTLQYAINQIPYDTGGTVFEIGFVRDGAITINITDNINIRKRRLKIILEEVTLRFKSGACLVLSNDSYVDISQVSDAYRGTLLFDYADSYKSDAAIRLYGRSRLGLHHVGVTTVSKYDQPTVKVTSQSIIYFGQVATITAYTQAWPCIVVSDGSTFISNPYSTPGVTCTSGVETILKASNGAQVSIGNITGTVPADTAGIYATSGALVCIGQNSIKTKGTTTAAPISVGHGARVYIGSQTSIGKY